jgi:hypothetical protein
MATNTPPPGATSGSAVLRVLSSLTFGALVGVASFAAVTYLVLSAPLSHAGYFQYRAMESTEIPVGEAQFFWTTLHFLPGAVWLAVAAFVGIELVHWWRREPSVRPVPVARGAITAAWLTAVGFVAWSIPANYAHPGRGPGAMIAWAMNELGWSFGFTGGFFAFLVLVIAPLVLLMIQAITERPPTAS